MSSNPITVNVALEVASHEAIVRQAYRDSVGVWTWSIGITSRSGHSVERYKDNPQSMYRCLEVFVWILNKYADDVREVFKGYDLTEEQFAAALSFHWNTGSIKRASWVDHWKAGAIQSARESFMLWRSPPEIIKRRKAERDLFFDGVWSNDGTTLEYTRLSSSYRPIWSSAVKVDITKELGELLSTEEQVKEQTKTFWRWIREFFK